VPRFLSAASNLSDADWAGRGIMRSQSCAIWSQVTFSPECVARRAIFWHYSSYLLMTKQKHELGLVPVRGNNSHKCQKVHSCTQKGPVGVKRDQYPQPHKNVPRTRNGRPIPGDIFVSKHQHSATAALYIVLICLSADASAA